MAALVAWGVCLKLQESTSADGKAPQVECKARQQFEDSRRQSGRELPRMTREATVSVHAAPIGRYNVAALHRSAAASTGKPARPRSIAARLACVRLLTPNLA